MPYIKKTNRVMSTYTRQDRIQPVNTINPNNKEFVKKCTTFVNTVRSALNFRPYKFNPVYHPVYHHAVVAYGPRNGMYKDGRHSIYTKHDRAIQYASALAMILIMQLDEMIAYHSQDTGDASTQGKQGKRARKATAAQG